MTDHMVHAGTDGLRERHLAATAAIIERGGDAIEFTDDEVMTNLIELFGRDARLNAHRSFPIPTMLRGRLLPS